jgi:hypothetical protein
LDFERNDECYINKFRITLELIKKDILFGNYILNKILHEKLDETPYEL